jgi:hypothetical protein
MMEKKKKELATRRSNSSNRLSGLFKGIIGTHTVVVAGPAGRFIAPGGVLAVPFFFLLSDALSCAGKKTRRIVVALVDDDDKNIK